MVVHRRRSAPGTGIDYSSVGVLAEELGVVPKEMQARLRPALRKAGDLVAAQAKANASWSTRIPGAIRVRTSFGSKGVTVSVDAAKAPNARPLEGTQRNTAFKHPVYGGQTWVSQPTRPFLFPAANAKKSEAQALVAAAVREALQGVRIHG